MVEVAIVVIVLLPLFFALPDALVFLCVLALPVHHFVLGDEIVLHRFRRNDAYILVLIQQIKILLNHFLGFLIGLVVLVGVFEVIEGFLEVDLDSDADDGEDFGNGNESHDKEGID